MADLFFTGHARRQMHRRKIEELDVELALKRETSRGPADPGTIWITGHARRRPLKVCVELSDNTVVITAAWPDEQG